MLEKLILLIDNRKEIRTKYQKHLNTSEIRVITKSSIKDALNDLTLLQPDLIMLSDSVCENLSNDIKNLRLLTYTFRPVIVALSKSSHLQDKTDALNAGADDYFEEPVVKEELQSKINAHLRRIFETQTNLHTNLYNAKISYKTLTRAITYNKDLAVLLVGINNFDEYKNIYGELAAHKMLQAYSAVIMTALSENDYVGQLDNDDFIITTTALKAEKLAGYLIHAFDLIAQKFYSEQDLKQGYMTTSDDDMVETPIPLVTSSIAVVSNEYKKYSNLKELMTDLLLLHKSLRSRVGSNYLMDRPKIGGENNIFEPVYNKKVLIIEEDEALNLLLESNFIMRNYNVLSISSFDKLTFETIKEFSPALIIIDVGKDNKLRGLEFFKTTVTTNNIKSKIILTTILHNKQEVLNNNVDLYLPKPYKIQTLMSWAEKLLKEFNS